MRRMTKVEVRVGRDDLRLYSLPTQKAQAVLKLVQGHEVLGSDGEPLVAPEDVFPDLKDDSKRPAAMLRGARHRDGLTQVELAKKMGITQANLASMEAGRRSISKKTAEKLAKVFKTNYRVFL